MNSDVKVEAKLTACLPAFPLAVLAQTTVLNVIYQYMILVDATFYWG